MSKSGARVQQIGIEERVVKMLARRGKTLALAESCTGGLIANKITSVSGASKIFLGGIVAYSNDVKMKFLGVRSTTLKQFGAVSENVACEMAVGARRKFGSNFAVAVTGIAGPSGGTKMKPVGTVFIALAADFGTVVVQEWNNFGRERFKEATARQALELLLSHFTKS